MITPISLLLLVLLVAALGLVALGKVPHVVYDVVLAIVVLFLLLGLV